MEGWKKRKCGERQRERESEREREKERGECHPSVTHFFPSTTQTQQHKQKIIFGPNINLRFAHNHPFFEENHPSLSRYGASTSSLTTKISPPPPLAGPARSPAGNTALGPWQPAVELDPERRRREGKKQDGNEARQSERRSKGDRVREIGRWRERERDGWGK